MQHHRGHGTTPRIHHQTRTRKFATQRRAGHHTGAHTRAHSEGSSHSPLWHREHVTTPRIHHHTRARKLQRSGEQWHHTRARTEAHSEGSTHSPHTKATTQRKRRKHHRGHVTTPRIHHHTRARKLQRSGGRGTTRGRARKHTARAAATHRTPKPPRNAAGASRATAVRRKPSAVRGRTTEVTIQHTNIEAVPPHTNNTSAGARASVWRGTRGNAVGVCKRLYHPPYPSWHCSHWERE